MRLETESLIIRGPNAGDVDDYMGFCNSEFVLRYNAMIPKSREEVLAQFSGEGARNHAFVMEHRESGRVIGVIFAENDSPCFGENCNHNKDPGIFRFPGLLIRS